MATIRRRVTSAGEVRYEAIIRLKRGGEQVHREARTFSRATLAREWARARELALEQPGALAKAHPRPDLRLGALIRRYRLEFEQLGKWGRSKGAALRALEAHPIADEDASQLMAARLVDHVRSRRLAGAGPATVAQDLVWIGVVLQAARGAWGLPVDPYAVVEARKTCKKLRLSGRPKRRTRRPTQDEIDRLCALWDRTRRQVPMSDVVRFAIASARRQDEITRLLWADVDESSSTVLVRDVKHPSGAAGNHRVAKLTAEALAIIKRQPVVDGEPRIFPYSSDAISAAFTRACKLLGIADLRFHDLRHEATSRLFEAGYQIHEVAQFTLHESWAELKRYTQLRPERMTLR